MTVQYTNRFICLKTQLSTEATVQQSLPRCSEKGQTIVPLVDIKHSSSVLNTTITLPQVFMVVCPESYIGFCLKLF